MTQILANLNFNKSPMKYMHIDLNSCFATVEQQANPLLRNKPIGVAAYNSPKGVILAASIQAKKLGIKTGTRVFEAKELCPEIIIVEPDANKYRYIHHKLNELLSSYTNNVKAKSVDEFVLDFSGAPTYKKGLISMGNEIKNRIKKEIGDYITVSIGISCNEFLAKTASNLKKPDGLEQIDETNYMSVYEKLELIDLTGIGDKNLARLNYHNIFSVIEFYNSNPLALKYVFGSIEGYYWYLKLRGYQIENYPSVRRSFSHQYALPKPAKNLKELSPILTKLVEKLGFRLRTKGYKTQGIHIYIRYKDYSSWHISKKTKKIIFDSRDLYKEFVTLYNESPKKEVTLINVGCFNLKKYNNLQLELFDDIQKKETLTNMLDKINVRWGKFVITPATMITNKKYVPDRIGFGNID